MSNGVWKSRKFWYAVLSVAAALIVAFVPVIVDLDADQAATFAEMVPLIMFLGFFLIGGHTFMDALSLAQGVQLKTVQESVDDLVSVIGNSAQSWVQDLDGTSKP